MTKGDKKEKQLRMTLQDTLFFQNKLRNLLKTLIAENRTLTQKEKTEFFEMLPKALLSQGSTDPTYMVIQDGWFIFSSVQNLAHRLADLNGDKVFLLINPVLVHNPLIDISTLLHLADHLVLDGLYVLP